MIARDLQFMIIKKIYIDRDYRSKCRLEYNIRWQLADCLFWLSVDYSVLINYPYKHTLFYIRVSCFTPCYVWNRKMFGLSDDILPQGGQPIFISIARYRAYIFGSNGFQRCGRIYDTLHLIFNKSIDTSDLTIPCPHQIIQWFQIKRAGNSEDECFTSNVAALDNSLW